MTQPDEDYIAKIAEVTGRRPDDRPAYLHGLQITAIGKGSSIGRIEIEPRHLNPFGFVSGPVIFGMIDTGMGSSLMPYMIEDRTKTYVTLEVKVTYLKAVRLGTIECHSRALHVGSNVAALESEIRCGDELIAKASGSWAAVPSK